MAKKKKEKVTEEVTQETKVNEPKGKENKGEIIWQINVQVGQ